MSVRLKKLVNSKGRKRMRYSRFDKDDLFGSFIIFIILGVPLIGFTFAFVPFMMMLTSSRLHELLPESLHIPGSIILLIMEVVIYLYFVIKGLKFLLNMFRSPY